MTHAHVIEQRLRAAEIALAEERERSDRLTSELAFMRTALDASETIRHGLVWDLARAEVRKTA